MASLVFQGQRVCRCSRHGFGPWVVGKICWRRKWQPTPVCLPGKPMDRGGRVGLQSIGLQHQTDLATTQQPRGRGGCHSAETAQKILNT